MLSMNCNRPDFPIRPDYELSDDQRSIRSYCRFFYLFAGPHDDIDLEVEDRELWEWMDEALDRNPLLESLQSPLTGKIVSQIKERVRDRFSDANPSTELLSFRILQKIFPIVRDQYPEVGREVACYLEDWDEFPYSNCLKP